MKTRAVAICVLATALFVSGGALVLDDPAKAAPADKMVGTWKLVSAKYGGDDFDVAKLGRTLKHITPGNFMWVSYAPDTGEVTRSAGGTYTFEGEKYVETPRYGISEDFDAVKDKPNTFTIKIDGDTLHQNGELSTGLKLEEVWERVKPK
jgi:hypothetical protein